MANPNKMTRADLVNFTTHAATEVADGVVTGFLAAQNTAISDALNDANAVLAANETSAVDALASYRNAVMVAQDQAAVVRGLLQNLKDAMRSVNSPGDEYAMVGFDPPIVDRGTVIPEIPTDLAAVGFSNNINSLNWVSHNVPGSVVFEIWAIIGDTAPDALVGTTTQQKWNHEGVTPGEYYEYHVRARAARNSVSAFSNSAVVYGRT